jgi:hypothetical protein
VDPVIALEPIGTVRSPYTDTAAIPKGQGAKHDAASVPPDQIRRGWLDEAEARRAR